MIRPENKLNEEDKIVQNMALHNNYKFMARVLIFCAWRECDRSFFQDEEVFDFYCAIAELDGCKPDLQKMFEENSPWMFKYLDVQEIKKYLGIDDEEEIKRNKKKYHYTRCKIVRVGT